MRKKDLATLLNEEDNLEDASYDKTGQGTNLRLKDTSDPIEEHGTKTVRITGYKWEFIKNAFIRRKRLDEDVRTLGDYLYLLAKKDTKRK